MVECNIDGESVSARDGASILEAALSIGIEIPAICYDGRCKPNGSCRMCLVKNTRKNRLVTACQTEVQEGDWIATRNASQEQYRTTELEWYADHVSPHHFDAFPDKLLHRLMREYNVAPSGKASG